MAKFRDLLKSKNEDTSSVDIAGFTTKIDFNKRMKRLDKGKKCKKHGVLNCEFCIDEFEDKKWK